MIEHDHKQSIIEMLKEEYGNKMLNRDEAAAALGMSTASLDKLRGQGLGPTFIKIGSSNSKVQYTLFDISDYICSMRIKTSS